MPEPAGQAFASTANLRVALVSTGLGHVQRGVETWMTDLATHLPVRIAVELWAGGTPPEIPGRISRTLRVMSRNAALQRAFRWPRRYINEQLSALPRTILLLRRHKPDIVYCGDPVLAWHLKGTQRIHGTSVVFMNGMRLAANWAKVFDGVHLIAPAYMEEAQRELGSANVNQFFVSPHFVDTTQFKPPTADQRSATRSELGLPADAFVILNVGPVGSVSGKRLDWLVSETSRAGEGAVLISVGGDEEGSDAVHAAARNALGTRFRPMGSQSRERLKSFYHAADAYALAALAEPFSIAILEALACGLPVVHHPFRVTSWITGSAGVAALMEVEGAAATALRRLADDVTWRNKLAIKARREVEQRFSAPVVCDQLADELLRVARRSKVDKLD